MRSMNLISIPTKHLDDNVLNERLTALNFGMLAIGEPPSALEESKANLAPLETCGLLL